MRGRPPSYSPGSLVREGRPQESFEAEGATPSDSPAFVARVELGFADLGGLKTFGAARHLELDAITLGEALEPLSLDGAEVYEHVLAALLRDDAKALRVVEPLHCSLCHDVPFLLLWSPTPR